MTLNPTPLPHQNLTAFTEVNFRLEWTSNMQIFPSMQILSMVYDAFQTMGHQEDRGGTKISELRNCEKSTTVWVQQKTTTKQNFSFLKKSSKFGTNKHVHYFFYTAAKQQRYFLWPTYVHIPWCIDRYFHSFQALHALLFNYQNQICGCILTEQDNGRQSILSETEKRPSKNPSKNGLETSHTKANLK